MLISAFGRRRIDFLEKKIAVSILYCIAVLNGCLFFFNQQREGAGNRKFEADVFFYLRLGRGLLAEFGKGIVVF